MAKAMIAYHEIAHASTQQREWRSKIGEVDEHEGKCIQLVNELASDLASTFAVIKNYDLPIDQLSPLVQQMLDFRKPGSLPDNEHNIGIGYEAILREVISGGEDTLAKLKGLSLEKIGTVSMDLAQHVTKVEVENLASNLYKNGIPISMDEWVDVNQNLQAGSKEPPNNKWVRTVLGIYLAENAGIGENASLDENTFL